MFINRNIVDGELGTTRRKNDKRVEGIRHSSPGVVNPGLFRATINGHGKGIFICIGSFDAPNHSGPIFIKNMQPR